MVRLTISRSAASASESAGTQGLDATPHRYLVLPLAPTTVEAAHGRKENGGLQDCAVGPLLIHFEVFPGLDLSAAALRAGRIASDYGATRWPHQLVILPHDGAEEFGEGIATCYCAKKLVPLRLSTMTIPNGLDVREERRKRSAVEEDRDEAGRADLGGVRPRCVQLATYPVGLCRMARPED